MKYAFLLSGDYIDLAKEEIISLFDIEEYKLLDRLLIADLEDNEKSIIASSKRFALTKSVYKLLFECKISKLIDIIKDFDWNSVYKDNFCLRLHYFGNNEKDGINKNPVIKKYTYKKSNKKIKNIKRYSEKDLAKYIWRSVEKPKVNLDNPKTKIELFIFDNKAYCGLLVCENNEDFESRKSHLRPFPNPSSLHPKLARALVNMTGAKENEALLDPFCGTGGFLIEAGLMGINCIGYDINKTMAKGCIKNLGHFDIKNYKITNKNALDIDDKFDYVVTDLPYGLNSNAMIGYQKNWKEFRLNKKIQKEYFEKILEQFYLKFLKSLRKKLKKKAVIVFPSYVNYKNLLKLAKFRIEKEFEIYVHRSLTRKIVKVR